MSGASPTATEARAFGVRALTDGEAAIARSVFGDALPTADIRLLAAPWPLTRAFVPGWWFGRGWIVWPRRGLPQDIAAGSLGAQATLVHELVHLWQALNGVGLLRAKLRAGDGPAAYAYPLGDDCAWERLNIEQQASVVEDRFRLSRGGTVRGDRAFYDRVCPF